LTGFNHQIHYFPGTPPTANANATNYMSAFPSGVELSPAGSLFGWGDRTTDPNLIGTLNAIHMSVIPKGPYRGQVLVWNREPVLIQPNLPTTGSAWWACQAYSIVNPDPGAPMPRFRNYVLPLHVVPQFPPTPGVAGQWDLADLFCTGHAWSENGDLVIAGGATLRFTKDAQENWTVVENGAKFTFLLDLARPSAITVGSTLIAAYPGDWGEWREGPPLAIDRYYPTVTMTHRLTRTNLKQTAVIGGGVDLVGGFTVPNSQTEAGNTYESYLVEGITAVGFLAFEAVSGQRSFFGPGLSLNHDIDWLQDYPRLFLLGDGSLFKAGYTPGGARLDLEVLQTTINGWDSTVGAATTSAWNHVRHDGMAVFFARLGTAQDLVVRLGGFDDAIGAATNNAEFCPASQTGPPAGVWYPLGDMLGGCPGRTEGNAVVVPDASIVVIGGNDPTCGLELATNRYSVAQGFERLAPSPTGRGYHATAVVLPSGRVFVGGGDGRFGSTPSARDYDTFEPPYLHGLSRPNGVVLDATLQVDAWGQSTYVLGVGQTGVSVIAGVDGMAYFDKVVLLAPGSITHHTDMSARCIDLHSTAVYARERTFDLPAETVVPRGYYMLWAVTNGGIPSEAVWILVQ